MKRSYLFIVGVLCSSLALGWAVQATTKLYVGGNLASNGVIERNGVAYVPLKDVATALKMNVSKSARGWEMGTAGGANMTEGVNGKIGEVLFNGYWRFQVVKMYRGNEYTNQFSGDSQKVTPYPDGMDLVVLTCRIKNGTKNKVTVLLPAGELTGITDDKERSVQPRNGLSADIPNRGVDLLPGAALDFALTFDVPHEAKLKDLVYQVNAAVSAAEMKGSAKPFRVSFAEGQ